MNILADENCGGTLLAALRNAGHDVKSIWETSPGLDDDAIFTLARDEKRVLLTSDHDFGQIAERATAHPPAVLLMRLHDLSVETAAVIVVRAIANLGEMLFGHFVVVEPAGVRARRYKD